MLPLLAVFKTSHFFDTVLDSTQFVVSLHPDGCFCLASSRLNSFCLGAGVIEVSNREGWIAECRQRVEIQHNIKLLFVFIVVVVSLRRRPRVYFNHRNNPISVIEIHTVFFVVLL